jgi:3-deoxy-manno-octulosonate cytidylyltransferase (CMP-KDO synthetase)
MSIRTHGVIVIPSRYGSKRFPGKPLADILGVTMLERIWRIAKSVNSIQDVYITTDDQRIEDHAKNFGASVIRTSEQCENGTVRTYEAINTLPKKPDFIINFQGDAVLTPPWIIQALVNEFLENGTLELVTPVVKMTLEQVEKLKEAKANGEVSGTTAVLDKNGFALYFSKAVIPFVRKKTENPPIYRHIGIYGYSFTTLERYIHLEPTELEEIEGLEQLRALENGIKIKCVPVDYRGRTHWSVDSPEDKMRVEDIIRKEGELI